MALQPEDQRILAVHDRVDPGADIAGRMLVSERTAKRMVAALLNRLGVTNRIAAAAMAGQFGLLEGRPGVS